MIKSEIVDKALKDSIAHWRRVVIDPLGEPIGPNFCALCIRVGCADCPVSRSTGQRGCKGTPYDKFVKNQAIVAGHFKKLPPEIRKTPHLSRLAEEMLRFLLSLEMTPTDMLIRQLRIQSVTPEQQAAYVNAQTACALIEAAGMTAENKQREVCGHSMAYVEEDFLAVIEKYGIHHDASMTSEITRVLEDSILQWRSVVTDPLGEWPKVRYCALLSFYSTVGCSECPVFARTGKPYCLETPYDGFFNTVAQVRKQELHSDVEGLKRLRKAANNELQFLISLREGFTS